jgi:HEAT repeats
MRQHCAWLGLVVSMALSASAFAASADETKVAAGVRVTVSRADHVLRYAACQREPCDAAAEASSVELPANVEKTSFTVVGLGAKVPALHFVADAKDERFEALFVDSKLVFQGRTRSADGNAASQSLRFVAGSGGAKLAVKSMHSPAVTLCGESEAAYQTHAFDVASHTWVQSTLNRLSPARVKAATLLEATENTGSGSSLLRAMSTSDGPGGGDVSDGNPHTAWTEQRGGEGRGEFVTFASNPSLPMRGIRFRKHAGSVAPKRVFIATQSALFDVVLPRDGMASVVMFPAPVQSSCVSLVLNESFAETAQGSEVGLSELQPIVELDAVPHSELGTRLDAQDVAPALLEYVANGDEDTLAAVAASYPSLGQRGKLRVLEIAQNHANACAISLTLALWKDKELAKRIRPKIERCAQQRAFESRSSVLVVALEDPILRAEAAEMFAMFAPDIALKVLPFLLSTPGASVRGALARVLAKYKSDQAVQAAFSAVRGTPNELPFLFASHDRVAVLDEGAVQPKLMQTMRSGSFDERYLALSPIAVLARRSTASASLLREAISYGNQADAKDAALRARAVALAREIPSLHEGVAVALNDKNPRVRLEAIRGATAAERSALRILAEEPWTFLREAAVEKFGELPADPVVDQMLSDKLHADPSRDVRMKSAIALGLHRAKEGEDRLMEAFTTDREDPFVRAESARALGRLCAKDAASGLTERARETPASSWELQSAAIEALGTLHPPDLAERLAPLRQNKAPTVQVALKRALDPSAAGCKK